MQTEKRIGMNTLHDEQTSTPVGRRDVGCQTRRTTCEDPCVIEQAFGSILTTTTIMKYDVRVCSRLT
jgi:hypothetical protein